MITALASLKSLIKTKSYHIDYPLFRLHYQATVCALLAFSLILTAKILFGDTIDCKGRIADRDNFYDNICFSRGTFTQYAIDMDSVRKAATEALSTDSPSPGAAQLLILSDTIQNTTRQLGKAVAAAKQQQQPQDVTESPSFLQYMARVVFGAVFHNPDELMDSKQVFMTNMTSTRFNVTNHTFIKESYFNEVLSNSNVGSFIKDQYRTIHRIIKNNNIPFSTNIRYIYSGIMIPRETRELYTITYWHRYYQYISIMLFLQAVFFYIPHYLWKNWENGIVSSICKRLHENRLSPTEYIESNYHMIDYLQNCFTLNKSLVYKYYICQLLLLVNLIGQIAVLNAVFNDQFITYGIDVFYHLFLDNDIYGLRGSDEDFSDINNPMDFVFPKVTGCTFVSLSQAGVATDENQFLCVLPLNILHDKFFLVLWFWFLILGVLTIMQIIFDTLYIVIPKLRKILFRRRFGRYLSEDNRHSSSLPELFLLDLIGTNSDKFAFAALLGKLNKEDHQASATENHSLV